MIIVKKKTELLRFGLFLALAGGLLIYVLAKSEAWQKAEGPTRSVPTLASVGKPVVPQGLPGQLDLDGESYFADHRITRDQLAAAQREEFQTVMNDEKTDAETRKLVQQRYLALGEQEAKAKQAEQLIKARGYQDAAVSITEESAAVVVKGESVSQAQFVWIADIVSQVTGIRSDRITVWARAK